MLSPLESKRFDNTAREYFPKAESQTITSALAVGKGFPGPVEALHLAATRVGVENSSAVGAEVDAAEYPRVTGNGLADPAVLMLIVVDAYPACPLINGAEHAATPADHADQVHGRVARAQRRLAEAKRPCGRDAGDGAECGPAVGGVVQRAGAAGQPEVTGPAWRWVEGGQAAGAVRADPGRQAGGRRGEGGAAVGGLEHCSFGRVERVE